MQCGVTGEQLWLKINEPTDKDKGKYAIDIFAGEGSVRRVLDLAGQGKGLRCFELYFNDIDFVSVRQNCQFETGVYY